MKFKEYIPALIYGIVLIEDVTASQFRPTNRIIKEEVVDRNNDGLEDKVITYENGFELTLFAYKDKKGNINYKLDDKDR